MMSASRPSVSAVHIIKWEGEETVSKSDLLAVEEPLEIRLVFGPAYERREQAFTITMRSPGQDFELALGLLWSEGIIQSVEDVQHIRYCETVRDEAEKGNVLKVSLIPDKTVDLSTKARNLFASSSCGVCGKAAIEGLIACANRPLIPDQPLVKVGVIHKLGQTLQAKQTVYAHTGGQHAAALFDIEGNLLLLREDIGRHNAVDKIVGAALSDGKLDLAQCLLFLSGRAGFELVQKARMAGIPIVASVGAPSSLAVQVATESKMTLLGFVREGRFNVYSGESRLS